MKKVSFKMQMYLSIAILAVSFLTASFTRAGAVINGGYILCGLLFLLHPVWPAMWDWRDRGALKKGVRAGALAVIIIFGFWFRYNP